MLSNLLFTAGLACALLGALMLFPSFAARRFAAGLLAFGGLSCALAAYGYSAPLSLWRYPAGAALPVFAVYAFVRLLALRPAARRAGSRAYRPLFETPRAMTLRLAAEREAAGLAARELALAPRDTGVVYLRKHWERRWWSDKLGVSIAALEAAIVEVGPMTHDVRRHLALRHGQAA